MKVLIVNASDSVGGAAIVAHRLLHALVDNGVDARMLVCQRRTDDALVTALPRWRWIYKALDRAKIWIHNRFSRRSLWLTDIGAFGTDITQLRDFREADVIHLHWVNQGMLSLADLRRVLHSGKRVVWTMHDMWAATAICHHAADCTRFSSDGCRQCPQLLYPATDRLTAQVWGEKLDMYRHASLHLVACSTWMAQRAHASLLTRHLPITVIPNVFDRDVSSLTKVACRERFGVPTDVRVICFAAARIDNEIKGFDDLSEALRHLPNPQSVLLLLIGGIADQSVLSTLAVPYRYLGYQTDTLSLLCAADCLVSCSRFETLPTTIVEAQAVGTTPVAYRHSGALDLIDDGATGYFAPYRDTRALASAIHTALTQPLPPESLRQHVAHRYSAAAIAQQHIKIYQQA